VRDRAWNPRRLTRYLAAAWVMGSCSVALAQESPAVGREAALALRFRDLEFVPPEVQKHTLQSGVTVFHVVDPSLPLVAIHARFRGGYALLPRESYAAAMALPGLLRSGGTAGLSPDSVDHLLDFYAIQLTLGAAGESTFSSLNTLTKHLEEAVELWAEILARPRFDSLEVEIWRGRQMEDVRRRKDDPTRLAFSEFNRIMFGDHPTGWEMAMEDLSPQRLSSPALAEVHGRILCPDNLILGVVGDVPWERMDPLLERLAEQLPTCSGPLPEPLAPRMREEGGVYLIPRKLTQSTVVLAQPGGISQTPDPDYFASRIGNAILGAGGFSSRLLSRVRTEKGYAYSASSVWTTPAGYEGIVGAVTQTRAGTTIAAVQLILDIMEELRNAPPARAEVDQAVAQIVNGFVFNFQDLTQIVAQQMFYLAQGLPEDWLSIYLRGIQQVEPAAVLRVFRQYVDPRNMVILILGDPEAFDLPPEVLGEVRIWQVEGAG